MPSPETMPGSIDYTVGDLHFSRRLDAQRLVQRMLSRNFALADHPDDTSVSLEAVNPSGVLLGTSWVRLPEEQYDADPRSSELLYLAVRPGFQRQSIGSALLQASEEKAKLYGMEELWLWSVKRAIPFYAGHGYLTVSDTSNKHADCVAMAKSLLEI